MMPIAAEWMDPRRAEPNGTVGDETEHAFPVGGAAQLPARLRQLFGVLERSGERWCLLRPVAMLEQAAGDIDLLVEPSSLGHLDELLASEKFAAVPIRTSDLHAADYDRDCDRFLWLHIQCELRLGTEVVPARTVLDTVERDPLPQPADEWLFWILLLHDL